MKKALEKSNREFYYKETDNTQATENTSLDFFHINNTLLKDIFPIDVGYEKHSVNEDEIVNKFPYYLMHFVCSGKGYIEFDGVKTTFGRNMFFVLPPNVEIRYNVDRRRPWEYYWINFNGTSAKKLLNELNITQESYYLSCPASIKKYFIKALNAKHAKHSQVFTVTECIFGIFAEIAEVSTAELTLHDGDKTFFEQIFSYITENIYDKSLSAKKIAELFYINPCYFSTLFKKNANTSFRKYVNYERIKKATELIETTNILIKEISEIVGFTDPLYFGKVFKQYRMVSPQEYRLSKT